MIIEQQIKAKLRGIVWFQVMPKIWSGIRAQIRNCALSQVTKNIFNWSKDVADAKTEIFVDFAHGDLPDGFPE